MIFSYIGKRKEEGGKEGPTITKGFIDISINLYNDFQKYIENLRSYIIAEVYCNYILIFYCIAFLQLLVAIAS